ncbi:14569_t:CDS:1, partial [Racocetra persica]
FEVDVDDEVFDAVAVGNVTEVDNTDVVGNANAVGNADVVGNVDMGGEESCANRLGIIVSILIFDRSMAGRLVEGLTLNKLVFRNTTKIVNARTKDTNDNENRQKINILLA